MKKNITLNKVNHLVETISGDNRKKAPVSVADRVLMGYFGETLRFIDTAITCLKDKKGIIHYHDKFAEEMVPDQVIKNINKEVSKYDRKIKQSNYIIVKSFAPGINHYVFDLEIGEK